MTQNYREKSLFSVCKNIIEKNCISFPEHIMKEGKNGLFINLEYGLEKSVLWLQTLKKSSLIHFIGIYSILILYYTIILYYYTTITILLYYIDMLFIIPFSLHVANLCNFSLQIFADIKHFSLQGVLNEK